MNAIDHSMGAHANTDLVAEANHRIANHLSLLAGMVQMQMSALSGGPDLLSRKQVRGMLQETAGKIVGIGHMHRRLAYRDPTTEIDLGAHLIECTHQLISHLSLNGRVSFVERIERGCIVTADQAQTVVLIAGEIVMNAVKHAHPTGLGVCISIVCACNHDGTITVEIGDDGVGLPEAFNPENDGGLGLRLIRTLADKLQAKLTIDSDPLGLSFRLRFAAQRN